MSGFLKHKSLPLITQVVIISLVSISSFGDNLTSKWGLDWYGYYEGKNLNDRVVDPTNQIFELPYASVVSDFRPDGKFSFGSFDLRVQPRWEFTEDWIGYTDGARVSKAHGYFDFSQIYLNWTASDIFMFSFGLQNYQWGPAEMLSPSNGLIHFSTSQRSLIWVEPGHWLGRINISFGKNWSLIGIEELIDNRKPAWIAGSSFSPRGLVKFEYRTDDGTNYLGMTAGGSGDNNLQSWVGEYATYSPLESLSIYIDARQVRGSYAYYPETVGNFVQMQQSLYTSNQIYGLTETGLRYEGRVDSRIEYIQNDIGYTREDFTQAVRGASQLSPFLPTNLPKFLHPGLELYSQHYLYGSIRIPDLGKKKLYTVIARCLYSITDSSSTYSASIQRIWGDYVNLFLEASYLTGENNTELGFINEAELMAGMRLSF